jgi:two-component system sensor histidine kinase PilS (NtrC family)
VINDSLIFSRGQGRRILRLYHIYRLLIGGVLVLMISSDLDQALLKLPEASLLRYFSWFYLIINLMFSLMLRQPKSLLPLFVLAVVDMLLLCALLYAAGGISSGIGNLMVVAVAIANILLRGRIGLLIAAVAAIGLIYVTFYLSLADPAASNNYLQAGALGALCFAAALFVQSITRRLQQTETLAEQRATAVANLEALNSLILQRMRTGILLVDSQMRLLLSNPSASQMLGRECIAGDSLPDALPTLHQCLRQWQRNPARRPQKLQAYSEGPVLQSSFVSLPHGQQQHILVFLEDISQIAQHAQQLKLASLGRFTAGIAHEIRNPLGAISHAAQLLLESDELAAADQRLAQIVQDQSRRMNLIIENVLQLSRRSQSKQEMLQLDHWLEEFGREFREQAKEHQELHIEFEQHLHTRMDPHQLAQIVGNLVENGLRYSARKHGRGQVWLRLFRDPRSDLPILEVLDDGAGVAAEQTNTLFEPFYTTESNGTGLGLYISRELCESNQARLDFKTAENGGSCFRITFAHPGKLS